MILWSSHKLRKRVGGCPFRSQSLTCFSAAHQSAEVSLDGTPNVKNTKGTPSNAMKSGTPGIAKLSSSTRFRKRFTWKTVLGYFCRSRVSHYVCKKRQKAACFQRDLDLMTNTEHRKTNEPATLCPRLTTQLYETVVQLVHDRDTISNIFFLGPQPATLEEKLILNNDEVSGLHEAP